MMDPLYTAFALFAGALVHATLLNAWRDRVKQNQVTGGVGPESTMVQQRVTIVVPARNAAPTLVPLLQDLHAQDLPKSLVDVIVVDDGSEDATVPIVQGMMRTWPQLRSVRNEGVGKKAAITTAVEQAIGEIILLTDADARCGAQRTRRIVRSMIAGQLDLLILPVCTQGGGGFLGRLQEEEQAGLLGMAAGEALMGRASLANGANLAFTRAAFQAVGGYAGDRFASGDDVFLVERMKRNGKRIGYLLDSEAMVTVDAEHTWSAFLQQRLRWAGKMRGVRGGISWMGLFGLLLPWLLLVATSRLQLGSLVDDHGVEVVALLAMGWLFWIFPVVALVGDVKRFLGQRRSGPVTIVCHLAFTLYAPIIALLAMVVRPTWKGRPIRT